MKGSPRRTTAWLIPFLLVSGLIGSIGGPPSTASAASSQVTLHRSGCSADGATDDQGTVTFTPQGDGSIQVDATVTGGQVDNTYQARLFTECGSWAYTDGNVTMDGSGHASFSFLVPAATFAPGTTVGLQLVNPASATTPPYADLLTTPLSWQVPSSTSIDESVTLASGMGSGGFGTNDPINTFVIEGSPTTSPRPAIITKPFTNYGSIAGARWISVNGDQNAPDGTPAPNEASGTETTPVTTDYATSFRLPEGLSAPSFSISLYSDNAATVYVNGHQVGQQPQQDSCPNFGALPDCSATDPDASPFVYSANDASFFHQGANALKIAVKDFGGANGVVYTATISYSITQPLLDTNLIINGDAELGPGTTDGSTVPPASLPGWTAHGNFTVAQYDSGCASSGNDGCAFVWPDSSAGPPDHGQNLFVGGIRSGNQGSTACGQDSPDVSCATQSIDVSALASSIDANNVPFHLSGYLGGFVDQTDNAVLTATFESGGEFGVLGTAHIGPVTPADRNDQTKLLLRSTVGIVPPRTRTIDIRLDMTYGSTGIIDGYADSLQLILSSGITDMALTVAPGDDTTGPGVSKAALGNIPLTDVPDSVPPDPSDAPVGKSPVGKSPVGKSPVGKSPVGKSPVGKSPVGKSPVGKSPVGKSPVGKSPVGKSPVGKSPLASFILLRPGGWPAILAHTANLTAATPQSVTWNDLLNDPYATDADPCTLPELRSDPATPSGCPSAPAPLTLDQIVWSTSPIADLSFLSLLMGDVTWNDVTAPTGGWCPEWDQTGHPCASTSDLNQTIFESEANGLPSYLTSLPTKHVSDISDPSTTLFWGITLIDLNVDGSFLKNVKIADIASANRSDVVDCSRVDCSNTSTDTLGDAYDNQTTPGDLTTSALKTTGTFAHLGLRILGGRSLTAIEIAFLDPRSISWEDVPLGSVPWETFPQGNPTNFIGYLLDFNIDCRDSSALEARVHLPEGFRYKPNSSKITDGIEPEASIGDPSTDPETGALVWDLSDQACTGAGTVHRSLRFKVMPGFTKGTFRSSASADSATGAAAHVNNTAPVTIHSSFTGNDSPGTAAGVPTNSLLVVHPSTTPQYFTFAVNAGDEVQVSLSHQLHDGDIVLYAPSGTSSEPVLSANPPQPISFGKNPLDDPASNDATTVLPPESLQDVPIVSGLPIAGISNFRGTETDAVTATATKTGMYTLQIDWFNRDVGPEPAVATIRSFPPPDLPPCEARSFGFTGAQATSTPAIGAGVNTLLLFDQKRTGDMFGTTQANNIKTSLQLLAASSSIPGVNAQIVYLDSFSGVNAAFSTADSNPCSPANNNNVVKAINDAVASLGTGTNNQLANIRNVVIVGDDYLIPHAALNDETFDGNERDFTGDTFFKDKTNDLGGTFAGGYFFSDAPYGTRTPLSVLGKIVYLPQWAVGRLAGNGQTIKSAIDNFIASNGLADPRSTNSEPRTALVTDYDGFTDGGLLAFTELQGQVGKKNATRLTGAWTRNDYASALFKQNAGVSDPPDIVAQNGHHDQYRMLPGAFDNKTASPSDLFTTQDISSGPLMSKRVFFSLGCHFGLDFPAQLGTTPTDPRLNYWAKAYFDKGAAVLVGNLGYGYFDTKTTAFDERLLGDFVDNFTKYPTTGEALRQAEVKYFTTMGSFTPYDRKVIQEAIMWGFPMTRLPGAPSTGPAAPTPVTLGTDPVSGLPSTSITVAPTLTKTTLGDGSQFYQADDGTQATHPYPILPLVSKVLPLSSSGSIAKGAVPLSLTYSDDAPFKAAFANATVDSSTIESAPASEVGGYPSTLASIGTSLGPDGTFGQRLNVTPGVFRPTDSTADSPDQGLFRRITNSTWLVTYGSPTGSSVGPVISSTSATELSGSTAFNAIVTHPSGVARVFVQAFRPGGVVTRVELSKSGDTWSGGTTGTDIFEYWVFAISNAGTSASSTNKAVGYVPQPPPPPPAGVDLRVTNPSSTPPSGWYTGNVTVAVNSPYQLSIDGGASQSSPATVSGTGVHTVDAVSPDGSIAATLIVPIDATNPTISITRPASTTYNLNQVVTASYSCSDVGSGVATCSGTKANGQSIDTSSIGAKTFTVNSTDNAGNSATKSVTYFVGYNVCLLYDPAQPFRLTTSTIPLKLELCDANGVNSSSSNITLTAVDLQQFDATLSGCTNSAMDDKCWKTIAPPNLSTNASDGFVFRFSTTLATGGGYIYNYSIKGLVANRTYRLRFMVGSEATGTALHSAQFSTK
jgi:hypothetical protein